MFLCVTKVTTRLTMSTIHIAPESFQPKLNLWRMKPGAVFFTYLFRSSLIFDYWDWAPLFGTIFLNLAGSLSNETGRRFLCLSVQLQLDLWLMKPVPFSLPICSAPAWCFFSYLVSCSLICDLSLINETGCRFLCLSIQPQLDFWLMKPSALFFAYLLSPRFVSD